MRIWALAICLSFLASSSFAENFSKVERCLSAIKSLPVFLRRGHDLKVIAVGAGKNDKRIVFAGVKDWQIYQLPTVSSRQNHSLWDFVALYPEFAEQLGFSIRFDDQNLSPYPVLVYPDLEYLNSKLGELSAKGKRFSVRFRRPQFSGVDPIELIRNQEVIWHRMGQSHFDDLFKNWFAIVLPSEFWYWVSGHLTTIEFLRNDPELKSAEKFQQLLTQFSKTIPGNLKKFITSAGLQFKRDHFSYKIYGDENSKVVPQMIAQGLNKDFEEYVTHLYRRNLFWDDFEFRVLPFSLETMSLDQNSPQHFWKEFVKLSEPYDFLHLGLTKQQVDRIRSLADKFPRGSLAEQRIGGMISGMFKNFGTPNMESFQKLRAVDEKYSLSPKPPARATE